MIKEDFLQYLWQTLKFDVSELLTTEGDPIVLIENGFLNQNAGPDFLAARIQINQLLWVGSVEIHVLSSDWYKHKHQLDANYEPVILHVVLEEDQPVINTDGHRIPCLELKDRIRKQSLRNYKLLTGNKADFACASQIAEVPGIVLTSAIEKSFASRLNKKATAFIDILQGISHSWEHGFLILLSRNFGLLVNTDAFEELLFSIPFSVLNRERNKLIQLEALLFGQAGFLEENFTDEYPNLLRDTYRFQKRKYGLKPLPVKRWKFLRMRPVNFPTVRLAQLAALLFRQQRFVDDLKSAREFSAYQNIFQATASDYWNDHYRFDKVSNTEKKKLSDAFIDKLLINAVAPLYFAIGKEKSDPEFITRASEMLQNVKSEQNKIIRQWKQVDVKPESAFDSQGLLELYKEKCTRKKCLECPVGQFILNS